MSISGNEPHEIAFELDRTVPWLEGEGRAAHQPEAVLEDRGLEPIDDPAAAKRGLRLQREPPDRQYPPFAQTQFGRLLAFAIDQEPGRRGLQGLVPRQYFQCDRLICASSSADPRLTSRRGSGSGIHAYVVFDRRRARRRPRRGSRQVPRVPGADVSRELYLATLCGDLDRIRVIIPRPA